jgi:hypothetical protein
MNFDNNSNAFSFNCPNCNITIIVNKNEINCTIFRCGIYKNNYEAIHPHTCKEECERLKTEDLIYGCGKPFIFNGNEVLNCDYI